MVSAKSSLATVLAEESNMRGHRGHCIVGKWIDDQRPSDRELLKALMADPEQATSILSRVINRMGCEVSTKSVERHRATAKGRTDGCSCKKVGRL